MKRFFFEEEDDDDEDMADEADRMLPEFVPEFFAFPNQQENPAHHILNCSIKICEQSLFWKFMGVDGKMRMLSRVFHELSGLVSPLDKLGGLDAEI